MEIHLSDYMGCTWGNGPFLGRIIRFSKRSVIWKGSLENAQDTALTCVTVAFTPEHLGDPVYRTGVVHDHL